MFGSNSPSIHPSAGLLAAIRSEKEYALRRKYSSPWLRYVGEAYGGTGQSLFTDNIEKANLFTREEVLLAFYRSVRVPYPTVGEVDNRGLEIVRLVPPPVATPTIEAL